MRKFLITGGEGFIGYHICKELLKNKNNFVITYDAQKHFIPLDQSNWVYYQPYRIKHLNNKRLKRIRGDVTNRGYLKEILETYKPKVIIHLAALPIANICNTYPEEATHNIFLTTITLLDVIKSLSYKIDRIVYTSSSMVYGDFKRDKKNNIIPASEDQECNPKGIYGAMKLAGEILVKTYYKRFGIPYVIIRPSAVYGPTDCNKRVTEIFAINSLLDKDLKLDNGGEHMLDFSYVKDVAKGFVIAATSKKAIGETFNITCGEGRKIKELAKILIDLNPGSKLIAKKVNVYRPNRGALDISKAKRLLGYKPKYFLEDGVKEYVEFVKKTILKRYLPKIKEG